MRIIEWKNKFSQCVHCIALGMSFCFIKFIFLCIIVVHALLLLNYENKLNNYFSMEIKAKLLNEMVNKYTQYFFLFFKMIPMAKSMPFKYK